LDQLSVRETKISDRLTERLSIVCRAS